LSIFKPVNISSHASFNAAFNLEAADLFQTQNLNIQPGSSKSSKHVCQYQYIAAYIRPPNQIKSI